MRAPRKTHDRHIMNKIVTGSIIAVIGAIAGGIFTMLAVTMKDPDVYCQIGPPISHGSDQIITITLSNKGRGLAEEIELHINNQLPKQSLNVQECAAPFVIEPNERHKLQIQHLRINEDARFYVEFPRFIDIEAGKIVALALCKNAIIQTSTNDDRLNAFARAKQKDAFAAGFGGCLALLLLGAGLAVLFSKRTSKPPSSEAPAHESRPSP